MHLDKMRMIRRLNELPPRYGLSKLQLFRGDCGSGANSIPAVNGLGPELVILGHCPTRRTFSCICTLPHMLTLDAYDVREVWRTRKHYDPLWITEQFGDPEPLHAERLQRLFWNHMGGEPRELECYLEPHQRAHSAGAGRRAAQQRGVGVL